MNFSGNGALLGDTFAFMKILFIGDVYGIWMAFASEIVLFSIVSSEPFHILSPGLKCRFQTFLHQHLLLYRGSVLTLKNFLLSIHLLKLISQPLILIRKIHFLNIWGLPFFWIEAIKIYLLPFLCLLLELRELSLKSLVNFELMKLLVVVRLDLILEQVYLGLLLL
jgi:hypothetical protein